MNKFLIQGVIVDVKRVGGVLQHVVVEVSDSSECHGATPKIIFNESTIFVGKNQSLIKKTAITGIAGHIETVVKGRYGTVTSLVADKITILGGQL